MSFGHWPGKLFYNPSLLTYQLAIGEEMWWPFKCGGYACNMETGIIYANPLIFYD